MVAFLCGGSLEARTLLQQFVFVIVPVMNADGVRAGGGWGGSGFRKGWGAVPKSCQCNCSHWHVQVALGNSHLASVQGGRRARGGNIWNAWARDRSRRPLEVAVIRVP